MTAVARLNPPRIPPGKRPGNAPEPGAHYQAYLRAHWRATSSPKGPVPQSIAGMIFSNFQGPEQRPDRRTLLSLASPPGRPAGHTLGARPGRV